MSLERRFAKWHKEKSDYMRSYAAPCAFCISSDIIDSDGKRKLLLEGLVIIKQVVANHAPPGIAIAVVADLEEILNR